VYRKSIEQQYGGSLEDYLLDLGDATRITGVISHNFNAVELLGLREMMINFDHKRIDEYERIWRKNHDIPADAPSTLFAKAAKDNSQSPRVVITTPKSTKAGGQSSLAPA
jgi:hypothetical protein